MAYDFMEKFNENNERFKGIIEKYFNDRLKSDQKIKVGSCPPVFALANANTSLDLVMDYETIDHIEQRHFNQGVPETRLNIDDIKNIYEALLNPICLFNGNEKDSFVVITDYKNSFNNNITIPIYVNMKSGFIDVNEIATEFSNSNIMEYIVKESMKHNLLAVNNKKLENLLHSIGLLLPKENTNISSKYILPQIKDLVNSYDDSIIHNLDNVKYSRINDLENRYFKFNTDNKFFKPTFRANYLELNNACKELGWGDALQYFTEGEKLSKVRDGEYLWKIEMFKYDKDREQLQNKLIELKTKEIDEKLKEIKELLNNRQEEKDVLEISIDWENAKDSDTFNSLVAKELKNRNIDYAYDHFFKLRAEKYDLKVNVHTKVEDRTEYIESFETIKNKEKEGRKNEEFRDKYRHIIGEAPIDFKNNKTEVNNMLKGKEIEVKNINYEERAKDFIKNNISNYLNNNSYKDAVTLDQKIVSQYEYLKEHFGSQVQGEKGVGYHAAQAAALGLFIDDPTAEKRLYPDLKDEGKAFEQYCKDCSTVFKEMYEESKENLAKVKEAIRDEVKEFIENFDGGNTYEGKVLNCYSYYKNVFEQNHEPNVNGHVGAYIAQDGNLSVYHDDIRKIYGLDVPNKVTEKYQNENLVLWEIYKKNVNEVFNEMYLEAREVIENKKNAKPDSTIYDQIIEESANADIHSTLEEDAKKAVAEKEVAEQVKETEKEGKGNGIDEKDDGGRE